MKSMGFAVMAIGVLVVLGGLMVVLLATKDQEKKPEPMPGPMIVAKQNLQAFTLLNQNHLELRSDKNVPDPNAPKVEDFTGHCLLVDVKQGAEVKKEMLSPENAKTLVSDAVAVNIAATPKTTTGGQLRTGDLVDLVAVSTKDNKEINTFETLVLRIIPNKDTNLPEQLTLAIPTAERDKFAQAVVDAELLVMRKIR